MILHTNSSNAVVLAERSPTPTPSAPRAPTVSELMALDWMESHARIMDFWEGRLVADHARPELISILHRQAAWLRLMIREVAKG
ncbi:MAG: hypothetical protein AAGJ29_10155 [Pseudomonadota bacterium]